MRNQFTDEFAVTLTKQFKESGLEVDQFITEYTKDLPELIGASWHGKEFFLLKGAMVLHCYFVDGSWYCKF